jgi:hypothetical protein
VAKGHWLYHPTDSDMFLSIDNMASKSVDTDMVRHQSPQEFEMMPWNSRSRSPGKQVMAIFRRIPIGKIAGVTNGVTAFLELVKHLQK